MKKLYNILIVATVVATAFASASCSKDKDSDPTPPTPPQFVNAAKSGDSKLELKSVVIDDTTAPGSIIIGATPDAGIKTYEELTELNGEAFVHPYFIVVVDAKSIVDSKLDVKTTSASFGITNMLGIASSLVQITNGETASVSAGSLAIKTVGGKLTLDADFTLAAGGDLKVNISGDYAESPVPLPENQIIVDGVAADVKSVFVDDEIMSSYGVVVFGVSTVEGLDTYEKMLEMDEETGEFKYPFLMITAAVAALEDSQLDLMTTETTYSILNMSEFFTDVEMIAPGALDGLSAGSLTFKNQGGKQSVAMKLKLTAGNEVELKIGVDYTIPETPTSNFLSFDGDIKPVKTAYYDVRQSGVALYMTPARISSVISLPDVASYYVMLYADDSIVTGNDQNIASVSAPFEFQYVYPTDDKVVTISNGNLNGATGKFSVAEKGDGRYAFKFDITLGSGEHLVGDYDADFERYEASIYLLNQDPQVILRSAVVEKGAELTTIWLSAAANVTTVAQMEQNNPIILKTPTEKLGMGIVGFSVDERVSITMNGMRYEQAAGSAGNVDAALDGSKLTVKFNLFAFEEGDISLAGQYINSCVVL